MQAANPHITPIPSHRPTTQHHHPPGPNNPTRSPKPNRRRPLAPTIPMGRPMRWR